MFCLVVLFIGMIDGFLFIIIQMILSIKSSNVGYKKHLMVINDINTVNLKVLFERKL